MRKTNKYYVIWAIICAFLMVGCTSNFEKSYVLSDPIEAPSPKEDGRGEEIENLVTAYGKDYVDDPYLQEAVMNARRWHWKKAYESLATKAEETPNYLDVFRLQAELYLVNSEYQAALSQLDHILSQFPDDAHALSLAILAEYSLGGGTNASARLNDLERVNEDFTTDIKNTLKIIDKWINKKVEFTMSSGFNPEVIAVFGEAPRADYRLSQSVLNKVIKAKELLELHPDAIILVSGGAVDQPISEAQTMADWLIKNGVSKDKIILDELARDTVGNAIGVVDYMIEHNLTNVVGVSGFSHIPRGLINIEAYAENMQYSLKIEGVGTGRYDEPKSEATVSPYTYYNAFRSYGLIEKEYYKDYTYSNKK